MKKVIVLLSLLISTTGFAAERAYQLDMSLTMNNQTSTPKVIVKEGQKGTITTMTGNEEQFMDITATETTMKKQKGIMMKFVIGTVAKDGKRTVVATPEVFTKENEKATISVGDKNNKETMSLSVTATKAAI